MQRNHSGNDRGQSRGNLEIRSVGAVLLAVNHETVNFCAERVPNACDTAGKLDHISAGSNMDVRESLR